MKDNMKLLELANIKAAADREFIAYYLNRYIEIEKVTDEAVREGLKCDIEQYYRLGLCKAPAISDSDYLGRLNNISSYIGISALELNKIIKRVDTVQRLKNIPSETFLMAARDKNKKDDTKD